MMIADVPLPPKNPETTPEVVATYCAPFAESKLVAVVLTSMGMMVSPDESRSGR